MESKTTDELLEHFNKSIFKSNNPNAKSDIDLISSIPIYLNNEPGTIYIHLP